MGVNKAFQRTTVANAGTAQFVRKKTERDAPFQTRLLLHGTLNVVKNRKPGSRTPDARPNRLSYKEIRKTELLLTITFYIKSAKVL